ncbi:MAG: PhzF family phenazine biosynthesis protein [Spirochaetia bacterium]|nr:PhzF family phenazine biosynthesis protein [Spirochaetia bacterium]NCC90941.1 PhzF family phenazine biosynthesis protein [Spirochaetia bacterium]
MQYYHVDVFSKGPLTGNGLTVLVCSQFPTPETMLRITREMKQYETIFLKHLQDCEYRARIFTKDEELDFAGHPVLGAAAVIHRAHVGKENAEILFHLNGKDVSVASSAIDGKHEYTCRMNQGAATMLGHIPVSDYPKLIEPLGLNVDNLAPGYPLQVVTTGLPYLIVPIRSGLGNTGIFSSDYESALAAYGAKFVYVFAVDAMEGRTWDFSGLEDVATGSAAGPVGAYLCEHGAYREGEEIILHQGRFVGRPSELRILKERETGNMIVSGNVSIVAEGTFFGDTSPSEVSA